MRRAGRRSFVDIGLIGVVLLLSGVVVYALINRDQIAQLNTVRPASDTTVSDTSNQTSDEALSSGDGSSAAFGWSSDLDLEGESTEEALTGDSLAMLEEIARPADSAPSWSLDGTFARVRAIMNVNVRTGPSLDYSVIVSIADGTQVEIVRRSYDTRWIRVRMVDGREGWIFGELLELRS